MAHVAGPQGFRPTTPDSQSQLGFDFDAAPAASRVEPASGQSAQTPASRTSLIELTEPADDQSSTQGEDTNVFRQRRPPLARPRRSKRPNRRAVLRDSRAGPCGIDALVLMRTRTVMVSLIGQTRACMKGTQTRPNRAARIVPLPQRAIGQPGAQRATTILAPMSTCAGGTSGRKSPSGDMALISSLVTALAKSMHVV